MTSPDKSVPAGAYTGNAAGNISALQSVTFESAQASVIADISSAFAGAASGSGDLTRTTQNVLNAATAAQTNAGTAGSTATAAQNTTAANSVAIADLLATQQTQANGGSVFTDNFNRSDLGADYTTFKVGPVADLVIIDGEVGLAQDGDQNSGYVLAVNTARTSDTDDQAVSAVMGIDRNSTFANAVLIARAAADLSTFVWASANRTQVVLGCAVRDGSGFRTTTWTTVSATVHTGDTLTLECIGSTYQVLVNGAAVTSAVDAGRTSPVGTANRHFGFGAAYAWNGLFWSFSFDIAGFTVVDLAAPVVSGTGWSLQCLSASVSAPSGELPFPAGTFDTLRLPASNVTIIDQGLGRV
ncbi:hypothetical protein [Nocardia sp. BMG111209]|uniref:DUF7257 domain-containing protein n=1 Tax=Nocardia sp. BMG111209 TaxID=1160137 RepID=UPI00037FCC94|nr:hypothetical protein [Nocardia sp. BMG111209]